jgi:hypothetical protein
MRVRPVVLPMLVVAGLASLSVFAMRGTDSRREPDLKVETTNDLAAMVRELDQALVRLWSETGSPTGEIPADALTPVVPAPRADELTVLRRLSLALHGTIPSLEEIRRFQADDQPDRLARWTTAMLEDSRFSDYFAERLARPFVGVEPGQFLIHRRDRFTAWLAGELRDHRPYDEIIAQMIASRGVWTGDGEVNFITAAYANDAFDPNKLAARTARAFLGQRIDCAQCHNHPFDHWTQEQFEGLAAHYGHLQLSLAGLQDDPERKFEVVMMEGEEPRTPDVALPFNPEWAGSSTDDRERLAAWVTHDENVRFDRAIVNRVWGLMFGQPFAARVRMYAKDWITGESSWIWTDRSIDDLPDPGDPRFGRQLEILDLLGADFRKHNRDLRRLILVIAGSQAFQLESAHPEFESIEPHLLTDAEIDALESRIDQTEARWGVFPLIRLRPEQVIGSMLQANYVETIDQNSHLFVRAIRFFRERDFINEFGDPGVDELEDRTGTIQQALLRMNGDFASELSEEKPFSAPGQVARYSSTPHTTLDNVFLSTLTRTPTDDERACFEPQLSATDPQAADGVIQDLYWTLFNAPEFSWNH